MKKLPWILIFVGLAWWTHQLVLGQPLRLIVSLGDDQLAYLKARGERLNYADGRLELRVRPQSTWHSLALLYRFECLQADLSAENLQNKDQIHTADGGPYLVHAATLKPDGSMPDVNPQREELELHKHREQAAFLARVLESLDPQCRVGPLHPEHSPTPVYVEPEQFGATHPGAAPIVPLAQSNGISGGQTCVAMCLNSLSGSALRDTDINEKYGFELLRALNTESVDRVWKDGGEIGPDKWELLEDKVQTQQMPVIVALNGVNFSTNGGGQIFVITAIDGEQVSLADPTSGTIRITTRQAMNEAKQHPDGNFLFYPTDTP